MINMNFIKIRDVKSPKRWHWSDSWIDFFIPNDINDLLNAENCVYTPKEYISKKNQNQLKKENFNLKTWKIKIPSWYWLLIPSWIKIAFTEINDWQRIWEEWKVEMLLSNWEKKFLDVSTSFDLVFHNKSWVATKKNLIIWASVVDESYRGEIHIHLINSSKFDVEIEIWEKIVQWIIRPVSIIMSKEVNIEVYEELSDTSRWEWWFGSTWIK